MVFNMEVGDLLVFGGVGKSNLTRGRQYEVIAMDFCEVMYEDYAVIEDDEGHYYCVYEGDDKFEHKPEPTSAAAVLLDNARNLYAMGDLGGALDNARAAILLMEDEAK